MNKIDDLISLASDAFVNVDVGGGKMVSVRPISILTILEIWKRFPDVLKILFAGDEQQIAAEAIKIAPQAIAAIIAAATGYPFDFYVEKAVILWPDDITIPLLVKVRDLTMPDGIESFFGKLAPLLDAKGLLAKAQAA
jgi:hypothetical protein